MAETRQLSVAYLLHATHTTGRENWLAVEADRVLAEMCRCCGEQRVIAALTACATHKSMHVRAKVCVCVCVCVC